MNSNPAWQGAAKVARARLQTIDEALAKLEAVVPNVGNPPSIPDSPAQNIDSNTHAGPVTPAPTNPIETEIKNAEKPAPIPRQSAQALETFLGGAR